jgi:hypothetical protein
MSPRAFPSLVLCCAAACAAAGGGDTSDAPTTSGPVATTKSDNPLSTTAADTSTTAAGDPSGGTSSSPQTTAASSSEGSETTTGAPGCTKRIVVMGYWPPTNEMLRQWSTNRVQNPGGWQGENWRGLGYDVHAFFPEFPPDGDPTNDQIGDPGAVGSPDFDLQVDYQATSADFWRIVDELQPNIVVTTSRGGAIGWELEAIEGGHGSDRGADPSTDWTSDRHGKVTLPTQATIEPRSWDAISTFRVGNTVSSSLPLDAIRDATVALGLTNVEIEPTTSGDFLSGFLGLHGIAWQQQTRHAVAAGHIHVGLRLPVAHAVPLIEATIEAVALAHPAERSACPA